MKFPIAWQEVNVGDMVRLKSSSDDWEVLAFSSLFGLDQDNRGHRMPTLIIRSTRTRKKREVLPERLALDKH